MNMHALHNLHTVSTYIAHHYTILQCESEYLAVRIQVKDAMGDTTVHCTVLVIIDMAHEKIIQAGHMFNYF